MAISERDETAILVRDGLHIAGRHVLRMRLPWRGPKAGLAHEPREYKWVGIEHGVRWKILITHLPFGKAQQAESLRRIRRWFGNHRGPTIAGGDWNTPAAKARTGTGERVAGYGIDLTAYKRCRIVSKTRLGKHGSDHHAVLVTYEHTDANGKDQRLTAIWWNVRVGHAPADVRKAIEGWTTRYHPDVIGLSEAYGMRGHLSGLGYQVTQVVGKKAKK